MIGTRKNFHNPEYEQRKRKVFFMRIYVALFSVICVVSLCAGITYWSKISIDTVTVRGTYLISSSEVVRTVNEALDQKYAYIFYRKNALLYPKQDVLRQLALKFPRIETVSVKLSDYHTILVTITERQPKALWCDMSPDMIAVSDGPTLSPHCYFLDKTGYVYSESPDFSGDAYFKYFGLVPFQSAIGASYLSSSTKFVELSNFVDTVKKLKITPLYIVATSQDDFTMYIYGGGKIFFDDKESLVKTGEHLQLLLQTANLVPQEKGELLVEYIDLRYGNKLYYKVKNN